MKNLFAPPSNSKENISFKFIWQEKPREFENKNTIIELNNFKIGTKETLYGKEKEYVDQVENITKEMKEVFKDSKYRLNENLDKMDKNKLDAAYKTCVDLGRYFLKKMSDCFDLKENCKKDGIAYKRIHQLSSGDLVFFAPSFFSRAIDIELKQ